MAYHRKQKRDLRAARSEIFTEVVEGIGMRLPGCVVCVVVGKDGIYVCTSQYVLLAMNKAINAIVRNAFKEMPPAVLRAATKHEEGGIVTDLKTCTAKDALVLKRLNNVERLSAVHFYMIYCDTHKVSYQVRNEHFPLSKEAIAQLTEDIFKTWSEFRFANTEYGELLLHERL